MASPQREYTSIAIILFVFAVATAAALIDGRAQVRDDLRQQDITNLKHGLEKYFNAHEFYITPPGGKNSCTTSLPDSWFFGNTSPLLQEQLIDAIPHDVREQKGHTYQYCATQSDKGKTTGYYLQAELESKKKTGEFFDEDEQRKFAYRIIREAGRTLYRVCGGTEPQCEPQSK